MSIEDTQSEIMSEFHNLVGLYYNGLTANGFDLKESCESFWEFAEQLGKDMKLVMERVAVMVEVTHNGEKSLMK